MTAPTDLADRLAAAPELRLVPHAFREAYGRSAEGVWYAPGVVRLPPGGSVCGRWGAIVAGSRRDDGMLQLGSLNKPAEQVLLPLRTLASAETPSWAVPVARVVERMEPGGVSLFCGVDLPAGSGLSAQNALACAAALALRDLWWPSMPLDDLVAVVARCSTRPLVEAAFTGHTVGVDLAGAGLLVIDTRIRHEAPLRLVDCPASQFTDVDHLGRSLVAYHRAQWTEPEQDTVVGAALEAGALGASMVVDDSGRPVVALADQSLLGIVRAHVADACRQAGIRAPRQLTVRPAAGAHRVAP